MSYCRIFKANLFFCGKHIFKSELNQFSVDRILPSTVSQCTLTLFTQRIRRVRGLIPMEGTTYSMLRIYAHGVFSDALV